jgi:ferredoxin--NADP+ reductase
MAFEIVQRRMIVPNIHELTVRAPDVAATVLPGQFVIVRPSDKGERVPLSVSDYSREDGTVTCFFKEVGESTSKLAVLGAGGSLPTFVGPLGLPTEIEDYGAVLCVGGCYGIGSSYPVARALKEAGNQVYVLLEARSSYLLFWEDRYKEFVDRLFVITRDGTKGHKGHIGLLPAIFNAEKTPFPDRVIANGCTFMMKRTSDVTRPLGIKTIVSMNPIMIDGTGMCGVCRLTVDGKTKFACVDGPDFDGHLIDWDEFLQRRKTYNEEEVAPLRKSACGTAFHLGAAG